MRCFCILGMEVEINICLQGVLPAACSTLPLHMCEMYYTGIAQHALGMGSSSDCDVNKPIRASAA